MPHRLIPVVALAAFALAAPASAARPLVAIFYYPWYGTPQVDGAWEHWSQNGHAPPGDLYSSFYPAGADGGTDGGPGAPSLPLRRIASCCSLEVS